MIRFHLVRQVQVSEVHCETQCASVDGDVQRLEELLRDRSDTGTYGSHWTFVGVELMDEVNRG